MDQNAPVIPGSDPVQPLPERSHKFLWFVVLVLIVIAAAILWVKQAGYDATSDKNEATPSSTSDSDLEAQLESEGEIGDPDVDDLEEEFRQLDKEVQ